MKTEWFGGTEALHGVPLGASWRGIIPAVIYEKRTPR